MLAHAANTVSAWKLEGSRVFLPMSRPVQCPRMSQCGLSTAFTMRLVIWGAVHAQLRVDARNDDVELGEECLVLVEGAVFQDVDLDAGQQAERSHLPVHLLHELQLLAEPLGGQAPGDGQARAVVREDEVVVAHLGRGRCHLGDRAAAVGPVRVGVAVTLEQFTKRHHARAERHRIGRLELLEVGRHLARHGLGDHERGRVSDIRDRLQVARRGEKSQALRLELVDRGRRLPEGAHLVGLGALTLEQVGDASQGSRGSHSGAPQSLRARLGATRLGSSGCLGY